MDLQNSEAARTLEKLAERANICGRILSVLDKIVPPVATCAAFARGKILHFVEENVPFSIMRTLLWPTWVHVLSPLVALYLVVAVAAQSGLNLFVLHPLCMTIGCVLLMSEGFLVYRNGALVNALSPIMGGNAKAQARTIHMFLQVSSAVFMLAGFVFIAANKQRLGKSLAPASPHASLGALALLAVAVQSVVGPAKTSSSVPIHRWHGSAGKMAYDLCLASVASGAVAFLPWTFLNGGALATLALLWLSSQLQHSMGERKSGDGQSGSGGLGQPLASTSAHGLLTGDSTPQHEREALLDGTGGDAGGIAVEEAAV